MKTVTFKRLQEGTLFEVPLQNGSIVIGVAARVSPTEPQTVAYFFEPSPGLFEALMSGQSGPERAFTVEPFADQHLQKGTWRSRGRISRWEEVRSKWPLPRFVIQPLLPGQTFATVVTLDDHDPTVTLDHERVDRVDAPDLPRAGFCGRDVLPEVLERRLAEGLGLPADTLMRARDPADAPPQE